MRLVDRPDSDCSGELLLHLCLPALGATTRFILEQAVAALERDSPGQAADAVQIVLGEVLNNVVEHGYRDSPMGAVVLGLRRCGCAVEIEIRDWGRPCPIWAMPCDAAPDPADLAEGGYGWLLIRSLACGIRYRSEGCCNHLSLTVPI